MRTGTRCLAIVALLATGLCAHSVAKAQGETVTVACFAGQNIEGELLVAGDSTVWVKIESRTGNVILAGEDSASATRLLASDIKTITFPGSSRILLGAGIGALLGAGLGAGTADRRWEGPGAVVGGVICGLVGTLIGGLATRSTKIYTRDRHGSFAFLAEFARYGSKAPRAFELRPTQ